MKKNWWIPAALLSAVSFSSAFAQDDMDSRIAELERQMEQVRVVTPNGTCGANTALARPVLDEECGCCGSNFFVELSAIYWHPKVGGTEFAYTDQDPTGTFPIKGDVKDMDFSWEWGLKAGIGYNFVHDGWDVFLHYTWLDGHGSESTSAGLNDTVIPLRAAASITQPQGTFIFCQTAKSQFDFAFNALDLELGRHFFVSEYLSLRPFAGLKAAWIDLEQKTRYFGGDPNNTLLGLGVNTVHVKDTSDFWGIGPRIGIGTKWHLCKGFSIFGDFSGALVYGSFDVDHKERYSALADVNRIKLSDKNHAFSPTFQYQIGIGYDTYVNCDRNHISIRLSFDSQYWWRANQMLKVDDVISNDNAAVRYERISEDVSLHGVTLDLRVDF
ncbi:MAG: hypothetical protein Tsb0015_04850 [Simkaniaceae bacterium]